MSGDVISGVAVDYVGLDFRATFGESGLDNGRIRAFENKCYTDISYSNVFGAGDSKHYIRQTLWDE